MTAPTDYLLQLADTALVLAQRNAEWCGHGPVLEEDVAMANLALDLIGQARLLYQHAATCIGGAASEDSLAYFRDAAEYRCLTLVELPNHGPRSGGAFSQPDYATTIVRNFFHAALMVTLWTELQQSSDAQLAGIAARARKEACYHLHHCGDWLVRFGDGTEESHARAQAAVDHLLPYTEEFWVPSPAELAAVSNGSAPHPATLRAAWDGDVNATLTAATLRRPVQRGYVSQGKFGLHSEHLSYLLAEMQCVARAHPEGVW